MRARTLGDGAAMADGQRTGERVLRIIFPAHVDEQGRLHEASAVHAVVADGEWRQGSPDPLPMRNALSAAPLMPSLAKALAGGDPHLPDPAAVAAARARAADPVEEIKAEVARRLTRPGGRGKEGPSPGARSDLAASRAATERQDGKAAPLPARPSAAAKPEAEQASGSPRPPASRPVTLRAPDFPAGIPGEK
ncbi:hypothetical protein [Sphingobium baderi]|uniref:hypothetical protein n=1 Tax=Sphingobium baderi TaxID=1332080 RepID=UPI002B40279A|nr:hypothetical protein [Sphingobium baderi]WRD78830.1 TraV family lipoprotein [Sphingobium baderi]